MKGLAKAVDILGRSIIAVGAALSHTGLFIWGLSDRISRAGTSAIWIKFSFVARREYIKYRNRHEASKRSECPCCGWTGYDFLPLDGVSFVAKRIICPQCDANDRHRALHLYLTRRDQIALTKPGYLLNFAPEPFVHTLFAGNKALRYLAADLEDKRLRQFAGRAIRSDIMHIPLPDNLASLAFCLHIIEHVRDDVGAIEQLHRVLEPGGILFVMVPVDLRLDKTEFFGRPHEAIFGHYWSYAPDFIDKFSAFDAKAIWPKEYMSKEEQSRHGVADCEIIFRAVKR
jgi:SAM-dependent methyltransferase